MITPRVLITGADGYLGSRLAERYLEAGDAHLLLWMRAGNAAEGDAKSRSMLARLGAAGARVKCIWGDLGTETPFAQADPDEVIAIVHLAAVIRFNVEKDLAERINVEGTRKLLRFASRCRGLGSLGLISSVYASGLQSGTIPEAAFAGSHGFANHYESSKWGMERLLDGEDAESGEYAGLPWKIIRLATAVCDDDSGRVGQYNAFHNTLKLFHYGLMSIVPGLAGTPLYFITGEFAAESVFRLMREGDVHSHYHVCHPKEASITLGGLIDTAFSEFNREEAFRKRRILPPLYSDEASFALLSEGVESFGGGIVRQGLASVAPFARQLFIAKDIRNGNLAAALGGGYEPPDAAALIRAACRNLVATRWGRAENPREEAHGQG